jgi:hypothetical protein
MNTTLLQDSSGRPSPHGDCSAQMSRFRRIIIVVCLLITSVSMVSAQTYIDLKPQFDADTFLETGGAGLGTGLDGEGRRIDAGTLPGNYVDGSPMTTQDGRAKFQFAPFKQSSLDALVVTGQVIVVPEGKYESLDLAMLSAPGSSANPFREIELRYADGSKEAKRLGPLAGLLTSPTDFENVFFRFTDNSQVQTLQNFPTDFGAEEANYLVTQSGNGNSGGNRFIDGNGFAVYRIGDLAALTQATLAVTVGNNFVISLATHFVDDPSVPITNGFTVIANSMELYNGLDHHALVNLKQYDFDISSYLAQGSGELYILLTDASPSDGWGPFVQRIRLFTGTPTNFEADLQPTVDTSRATVYTMFRTDGTTNDLAHLYDNSGSGPSNIRHRFADATQSITYRIDLPDDVTTAKMTLDMNNNFVVSLSGPSDVIRYHTVTPGTTNEGDYLVDAGGSNLGDGFRFADGTGYMVYQFDLPDNVTNAIARVFVANQFVIEAAAGTSGEFRVEKDWFAETGLATTDNSNLGDYNVDLAPYLINNPSKIVQLRLRDGVPSDGWGPFLKRISIVSGSDPVFKPVLSSQDIYGQDVKSGPSKKYYTIDLTSTLSNNPTKEVLVKFTDGSTTDGSGPGIFWMAVYSGEIDIQGDRLVFNDLKTTIDGGPPVTGLGAGIIHRRYALNGNKVLSAIALPSRHPASGANEIYLLGATLNSAVTPALLKVAWIPDNKVQLSWSSVQTGYRLQSTATLGSPTQWLDIQGVPQQVGTEFIVEVAANEAVRYYRLVK